MNVSRFFGSTNREAMRQVRIALGPDALIVSNRRVNGGVEILATDATSVATQQMAHRDTTEAAPVVAETTNIGETPASASAVHEPMAKPIASPPAEVVGAIGAMQGALESRIDELLWSHQLQRTPETIQLFQTLLAYGFSTALLRAMLKRLPTHLTGKRAIEWARNELDTHLPVLQKEELLWQPGVALALVGPTGVGKTTTIAKLAARCVKRFGPDKLVLITTDTYRIGAHEQLKIYADLLRVQVHVVQDAQSLRQVMLGIQPDQVVLIDNVGISQRDRYVSEQASLLASSGRRIQRLLALNASSHGDTLDEVARVYKTDGGSPLIGCVITKVDEASRIGPALDTAIRYQLPIHYVSNGQKVPEHLQFLSASQLVDMAFNQASHYGKALYAPTSGEVAALLAAGLPEQQQQQDDVLAQRNEMLTRLLTQHSTSTVMDVAELQQQVAMFEQCGVLAAAYACWRSQLQPSDANADSILSGEAWLRTARHEHEVLHPHVPLLCMHQLTKTERGTKRLVASYVVNGEGRIVASPFQQLASANEWLSTEGDHELVHQPESRLTTAAMTWINTRLPVAMHAFEGGSASFWRECMAGASSSFFCAIPPSTRFWHKDGTTSAKALLKQLHYQAMQPSSLGLSLTQVGGVPLSDVAVGIARETIELRSKSQASAQAQLVALRLLNRTSNALLQDYAFLLHSPERVYSDAELAPWLLSYIEFKQITRFKAAAYAVLERDASSANGSIIDQVKLAALVAAASANIALTTSHAPLGAILKQLVSARSQQLSAPKTVEGLLKLFMMKNIMQQ